MAGTKREKRPGIWELRVFAGRDPVTGKAKQPSKTFRGTERQADKALSLFVAEVNGNRPGTDATFGKLLDDWLRLITPSRSAKTIDGYRRLIEGKIRPVFGDVPLSRLEVHTLDVWYAQLHADGLAPRTVRNVHAIIRAALNQAVRWRWIDLNVAELASPPSVPADPRKRFNDADVIRVIDSVWERDPLFGVLVLVTAALGCRRGEVCALRWDDIDLEAGTVRIHRAIVVVRGQLIEQGTKTHQERTVAVDPVTVKALRRNLELMTARAELCEADYGPASFVFSADPSGCVPLNPDRITHTWQRAVRRTNAAAQAAAREAGQPAPAPVVLRFHDLRHWHATYLLGKGVPLEQVSEALGHLLKSTTSDVYAHAVPGHDTLAAGHLAAALAKVNQGR